MKFPFGKVILQITFVSCLTLFLGVSAAYASVPKIQVQVLTHNLKSKVLSPLSQETWVMLFKGKREIPVQSWLEVMTQGLDLNDRAEIDMVSLSNDQGTEVVRVPRYMIVRKRVFFKLNKEGEQSYLSLSWKDKKPYYREISKISTIELANHKLVYPGTWLTTRTNPAASRGEKIFVQNCLSCHSVPGAPKITPRQIPEHLVESFNSLHSKKVPNLELDSKEARGLEAYKESMIAPSVPSK